MARAQRPKIKDRPLPVIVPAPIGPAIIPAEYTRDGISFSVLVGQRGTYELREDWIGRPILVRIEPV